MYVGNCLKTGDFLTVVPLGIPTTLQYNKDGNLEKVYLGLDDNNKTDISKDVLGITAKLSSVPVTIANTGGTVRVKGVLYTSKLFHDSGKLPECVTDSLLAYYKSNPNQFNFFAGSVDVLSMYVEGATAVRQWLTLSQFKLLPGYIIPNNLTRDKFIEMIDNVNYPFLFPMISHYMIFHQTTMKIVDTNMHQYIVSDVIKYVDKSGNIKARLDIKDAASYENIKNYSVDYSDVVHYNIQPNTMIVLDSTYQIVFSIATDNKIREKHSNKLTCTYCGKIINVPDSGSVTCPDTNCVSRLIPNIEHFMSECNLPVPTSDVIQSWIDDTLVTCIPDIFTLMEYDSCKIEIPVAKLIRAMVPISVVSQNDIFTWFVNRCNNSINSIQYYINNPDKITRDLDTTNISHLTNGLNNFIDWLSNNCNASDLITLFSIPNIMISECSKKFDGAPIFRNKTIYLTGEFIHGDISEISAILQSYSAVVITEYNDTMNCVLVGDRQENTNGAAIRYARDNGIPIFTECQFFARYGIDEDLKANLL